METDILEDDARPGRSRKGTRVRCILDLGHFIQHLVDTLGRGHPRRPDVCQVDHDHQRSQGGLQVVDEGHDLPGGHVAVDGLQAARPDDDHDADVHTKAQHRAHGGHELHDPDIALGEILIGRLEASAFVAGAHERLDHPHTGNVLLQDGVELVQFLLNGQEQRSHLDGEEDDDQPR